MVLPSPLASRGPSRADEESESLAVIFEHGIRPGSDVGPEGEDEDVGSRPGKPAPPLSSRGSIMSFSVSPRPSQQIEDSGVDVSRPPPIAITALEESNRWRPSALRSPRSTGIFFGDAHQRVALPGSCSRCLSAYTLDGPKSARKLPCEHFFCEGCIRYLRSQTGEVVCPSCHEAMFLDSTVEKLPLHPQLVALTPMPSSISFHKQSSFARTNSRDTVIDVSPQPGAEDVSFEHEVTGSRQASTQTPGTCQECRENPVEVECHDCASSFCGSCCRDIHLRKTFQRHRILPLEANITVSPALRDSHQSDVEPEIVKKFNCLSTKIEELHGSLEKHRAAIRDALQVHRTGVFEAISAVRKEFDLIFTKMQARQATLLADLDNASQQTSTQVNEWDQRVSQQMSDAKHLLQLGERALQAQDTQCLKELMDAMEIWVKEEAAQIPSNQASACKECEQLKAWTVRVDFDSGCPVTNLNAYGKLHYDK